MKYIFILYLVLPNILCFIISGHKKWKHQGYQLDGNHDRSSWHTCVNTGDIIALNDGENCAEMFMTVNIDEFEVMDEVTGATKKIQQVECIAKSGKIKCCNRSNPLDYFYSCEPITESICLEKKDGFCTKYVDIIVSCDCSHHYHKPL